MVLTSSSFRHLVRFTSLLALAAMLSGCGGNVVEYIRARDFRNVRAANEPKPAASPFPNVPDMEGWTTELSAALEFARENGRRTVVFVQHPGHPASERAKTILTTQSVDDAVGQDMRVAIDITRSPEDAARVGVSDAPALVILDSMGNPVSLLTGTLTRSGVLAALRN